MKKRERCDAQVINNNMVKVIKSSSMASRGAKKTVKIRELPACTQFDQRSGKFH